MRSSARWTCPTAADPRPCRLGLSLLELLVAIAISTVAWFLEGADGVPVDAVVILVIVLQLIGGPVGTHLLGRSVYRRIRPPLMGPDELGPVVDAEDVD